ncbi:hypothetical protein N7516_000485 [Penicillium verrucosum]|uniref:uncharacterized protein n=1 Tax=Penicillium verrucosum TaxID=60171 RepID=UPI002545B01C|nr:uncharacterized protein N7516_000485 [Penicillium verrucosum]KAJ5940317.1 hypothetical protein N7516_000485 [Penicillium verrucosum]
MEPLPGQIADPPGAVIVENHEEYEVERVLASRTRNRNLQYRVKWTSYDGGFSGVCPSNIIKS